MADTQHPQPSDGRSLPFSPMTLVLTKDPTLPRSTRDTVKQLTDLAAEGRNEEAHRLVATLTDDLDQRRAAAWFYLRELAGKRGARLLLRWLRAEPQPTVADGVFVAPARKAIEAWAQFRLRRYGRALSTARDAVEGLQPAPRKPDNKGVSDEARLWGQTVEAIRKCALRWGKLRLALNFHELAEALEKKHPGSQPDARQARTAMTAVAYLLDLHMEHDLPASLTRYLARSLGHDEGDSPTAYAELVRDLSLRLEHLDGGLNLASRFGFDDRVAAPLSKAREQLFHGNWQVRRALQRGALLGVYVLAVVLVLFGFVLLAHFVSR